ncbi:MAG: hypothetical protein BWY78_01432 [Alphaproteobacteria bacterium ADurb.Bin438]|nr:MAG: hypothetical protein BWY78_01432 [Alphaproteobacteria bacterium ADurb.Bin438]
MFKSKELDIALGEGNFKGDFTLLGKSLYDMISNINGSGNFGIKSGSLSNVSLNAMEKYHKIISVDNTYLSKNEISDKILSEVNKGNIDFVEFKGNFVANDGLFRAFETEIVVPRFDTKVESLLLNLKDFSTDINMSFALSKMEYPPLKVEVKGEVDKSERLIDVNDFIQKIVSLSDENREFAEAKARKNLADITKFLSDNDALYEKAREYIADLKEMFGKDNTLSVIYDNALDKYKEMTKLTGEKDELKKIKDSEIVSGDDVVNALNLYNNVEKIFKVIEQSRANTMAEAFKATISKYAKDATTSSNALLSLSTKNPDNKSVKDIFEKANQNAINAEALSHKALGLLDANELKEIQKNVVELAVSNIKLEANARDVLRNKVVKEGEKVEQKVKEEPKLVAPPLDLKLDKGVTVPLKPAEIKEEKAKVKGIIKRY